MPWTVINISQSTSTIVVLKQCHIKQPELHLQGGNYDLFRIVQHRTAQDVIIDARKDAGEAVKIRAGGGLSSVASMENQEWRTRRTWMNVPLEFPGRLTMNLSLENPWITWISRENLTECFNPKNHEMISRENSPADDLFMGVFTEFCLGWWAHASSDSRNCSMRLRFVAGWEDAARAHAAQKAVAGEPRDDVWA